MPPLEYEVKIGWLKGAPRGVAAPRSPTMKTQEYSWSFKPLEMPEVGTMVQGDQLYMAMCFWYFVKRDLFSVRYCTVAYTSVTFYTAMFILSVCRINHE